MRTAMRIIQLLILSMLLIVLTFSCQDKSTDPPINGIDTTSHNFVWETYTIESPYGSAMLWDVVIINENDIWAVGEIAADSVQPWLRYNALHFDGSVWELKRIPYIYNGSPIISRIRWIFAFNKNDIWFGNNVHWNGQNFNNANIAISIFSDLGKNKMWGSHDGEFYVVGNQGTIAYSPDFGISCRS